MTRSGTDRVAAATAALLAAVGLAACASAADLGDATATPRESPTDPGDAAAVELHCSLDERCREILIAGDPHATFDDGTPMPFRGYGDPSLEVDEDGVLWLAYSWLETLVRDPGPPPVIDFGVRTHLARSDDRGLTWQHVSVVNRVDERSHPTTDAAGLVQHEVPTLVREPSGWRLWTLDYFDPFGEGPDNRSDFHVSERRGDDPAVLGEITATTVLQPPVTDAGFGGTPTVSVPGLADCAVVTEPGLFHHEATTWLALHCLVLDERLQRVPERDRIVLLRVDDAGALEHVGTLLHHDDAAALGADVHTQPDLYVGRDGSVQLLVTPKVLGGQPEHRGCVVYEVADLASALLVRGPDRLPRQRARITADGTGLGPGLCTYDAASDTGVLLVITDFDLAQTPPRLAFSLRRTGVHP